MRLQDLAAYLVGSETDKANGLVDNGVAPTQYRFYAVAGAPHVPDHFDSTSGPPTSPATFAPELRARFLQGHEWVLHGTPPPPSTHLQTSKGTVIDRDGNGNAIVVDSSGAIVPRLPFVELGEATFHSGFRGTYDGVRSIGELGYRDHAEYLAAFDAALADQVAGGFMLSEDADAMRARAGLCPPLTFTETYRDHYASLVAIQPCN